MPQQGIRHNKHDIMVKNFSAIIQSKRRYLAVSLSIGSGRHYVCHYYFGLRINVCKVWISKATTQGVMLLIINPILMVNYGVNELN